MSILETIRKRATLLIILIGGSLVVFILEDAITSGKFFFGSDEDVIASVKGQKLEHQDVDKKIKEVTYIQEMVRQTNTLDDETTQQIQSSVFSEMVTNMIMEPEFKKLGITITDDELTDLMLGPNLAPEVVKHYLTDPNTGKIVEQIIDPKTGGINFGMWRNSVSRMTETQEADYHLTEEEVHANQLQQKYFALIHKSLFYTDAQAKQEAMDEYHYYNISYVLKKYSAVPDNAVSVTDQDIQNYYNQHSYEFNQPEETRKIDYVAFQANPTDKDIADLQNLADTIAYNLKTEKAERDSTYILSQSDDRFLDPNYHKIGTLSPAIDSVMTHAEVGYVYGPYKDMNMIRVAKLMDRAKLSDSVKVAHILIRPADPNKQDDWAKAKLSADSIKAMVTADNFADIAKQRSQDPGSGQKGGEIGWIKQQDRLVPEFIHAAFFHDKGDIVEFKSQFGYHIMLIEDANEKSECLHVGIVTKNIVPSEETINGVFGQASSFAGQASTVDLFESKAEKMNKRVADVKENEPNIPGITSPKELIRWIYKSKAGDISAVEDVGGFKYVVAHVVQINPKGTTTLDLVKEDVRTKAMEEKKAEKIIADMKAALPAASIAAFGQKMNIAPASQQRLSFAMYSIPGLGKEDELIGTMAALKPNTLSQPIKGTLGIYVIQVDSTYTQNLGDYRMVQQQMQQTLQNRAQYDLYDALQKKKNFVNHLGKFY